MGVPPGRLRRFVAREGVKPGFRNGYRQRAGKRLQRYITEFDFRYNNRKINDFERAEVLFKQAEGKRLTYRRTNEASHA